MPQNKNFAKRLTILDECFASRTGLYTLEKLIDIVSERLDTSVSRRTIQKDITDIITLISDTTGHNITETPIFQKGLSDGPKKAFRYAKPEYALGNQLLSKSDKEQLSETLSILTRYRNRAEFDWLDELFPRIESAFDLVHQDQEGLISYQSNRDYVGQPLVGQLYNLLVKKKVLNITYEPYDKPSYQRIIHPYHLKQYNNRWFLFGFQDDDRYKGITNLSLDRITGIVETNDEFIPNEISWEKYFKDFVGVSKDPGPIEKIKLRFDEKRLKYFTTKPIHPEWDEVEEEGETFITLDVIINRELVQQLLSFGKDVEVLEPESLRIIMKEHAESMMNCYKI